jgi:hypothetical protein
MRPVPIAVGLTAILFVYLPTAANAAPKNSSTQSEIGVLEESVEFRPSGRIVIRRWRDPLTRELLKIEMLGVVSGETVFNGARLLRNQLGEWRVRFDDGSACLVFQKKEDLRKRITCTDHRGLKWSIEVKGVSEPVVIPGVATEEESKLTISFEHQPT